jgi:hypothetical protein
MMKLVALTELVILLLIGGQGCATQLSLDPSPSAAASNYPTAEFWAQGKLFHGLGEIALKKGEPLAALSLKVQGYFEGTIRVDSGFCHLRKSLNYSDTGLLPIPLEGKAVDSCVLDIVVTSVYPKVYDSNTLVYEQKGQLLVKVLTDQKPFFLASSRVQEKSDVWLHVPTEGLTGSIQAVFRGCGHEYTDTVPINDSEALLSARWVGGQQLPARCVFEGFLEGLGGITRVSWNVWSYAREFSPLPLPTLVYDGERLMVRGDPSVAAIVLDDSVELSSKAVFKLEQEKGHVLRLITVKGRSVVCQWLPPRSEWVCLQ